MAKGPYGKGLSATHCGDVLYVRWVYLGHGSDWCVRWVWYEVWLVTVVC